MNLAAVYTRATIGIDAPLVNVEVHLTGGLPKFNIVGLPETAVKESKDRIRSALMSNNFTFPLRHITVNLAPADLPKEGGKFDLPIAIGILIASQQIQVANIEQFEFVGELGLMGELRAIRGALPIAIQTKKAQRKLLLPKHNQVEASLAEGEQYYASHLLEICNWLKHQETMPKTDPKITLIKPQPYKINISDIKGQAHAKRALLIAATGGHHLLLKGPPGTGKTMLAERLITLLPELTNQEKIEIACIHSIQRAINSPENICLQRPFRTPHHNASAPAIVGGGSSPKPGEISLAHNGVLFMDEFPEFKRDVLESLREPLEAGKVTIARAKQQLTFPAKFQLVTAMNPCPCGYYGDPDIDCKCTQFQIERYQRKLSGPLLDRIDLHLTIPRISYAELKTTQYTETQAGKDKEKNKMENKFPNSKTISQQVKNLRLVQTQRQNKLNANLSGKQIDQYCQLADSEQTFFINTCEQLHLSMRAAQKVLKVARTIADIENSAMIKIEHLSEAMSYRSTGIS